MSLAPYEVGSSYRFTLQFLIFESGLRDTPPIYVAVSLNGKNKGLTDNSSKSEEMSVNLFFPEEKLKMWGEV